MGQKNLATTISRNLKLLKKCHVWDILLLLVCVFKPVESLIVPRQDLVARKTTKGKHFVLSVTYVFNDIFSFFYVYHRQIRSVTTLVFMDNLLYN